MDDQLNFKQVIDRQREEISELFVGRIKELKSLNNAFLKQDERRRCFKILNAPGSGKTWLIRKFFLGLEESPNVITIEINCQELTELINPNQREESEILFKKILLQMVASQIFESFKSKSISIPDRIMRVISDISNRIIAIGYNHILTYLTDVLFELDYSVAIAFDEIQRFHEVGKELILPEKLLSEIKHHLSLEASQRNYSTRPEALYIEYYQFGLLRHLAGWIASFIKRPNVFVIAAGTQYSIVNSLEKYGSPLSGRTVPLFLYKHSRMETEEYFNKNFKINIDNESKRIKIIRDWFIEKSGSYPLFMKFFIDGIKEIGGLDLIVTDKKMYLKNIETYVRQCMNDTYSPRLDKFINNFGEVGKLLLREICLRYMFRPYFLQNEIDKLITSVKNRSETMNTYEELNCEKIIDLGFLYIRNGEEPSSDIINPYISVPSPILEEYLRSEFLDQEWLSKMGVELDAEVQTILQLHPTIVGFSVELFSALRLAYYAREKPFILYTPETAGFFHEQAKPNIEIIIPESPVLNAGEDLYLEYEKLVEESEYQTNNSLGSKLGIGSIYHFPDATGIDLIVPTENVVLFIQIKFKEKRLTGGSKELSSVIQKADEFISKHSRIFGNRETVKMLWAQEEPNNEAILKLANDNFCIMAGVGFRNFLGPEFFDMLVEFKNKFYRK